MKNPGDGDGSEELRPLSLLYILVTASEVCKYSLIYVLIFSMTFWAVVFGFFILAVKIEFLLFGKMLFVYMGGKLFEIMKSL